MNFVITLLAILATGLIGYLSNKLIKGIEYRNDYYKYIIEKRKNAYNIFENVINVFCEKATFEEFEGKKVNGFKILFSINKKPIYIDALISEIALLHNVRFWLTDEAYKVIIEINTLAHKVRDELKVKYWDNYHVYYLNLEDKIEAIEYWKQTAQEIFFSDLMKMHDVKKFKKEKVSRSRE